MKNLSLFLPKAYFLAVMIVVTSLISGFEIGVYIFKPLLIPILILYILTQFKNLEHSLIPLLLVSIFFSFLGDILFMITFEESIFKLLGICTFIVAQISYGTLYYFSAKNQKSKLKNWSQRWPEFFMTILFGAAAIFVYPHLGDFKTLGMIYAVISAVTIILALNRRFYVTAKSFRPVFLGVLCFFISDILTGIDLKLDNFYLHSVVILFYAIGHWSIIKGMCIQFVTETKQEKTTFSVFQNQQNRFRTQ